MAWHDATCAALKLEWKDGRPGCLTCQREAPALSPINPISPPGPPPDVPRSQLVCVWPPQLFPNDSLLGIPTSRRYFGPDMVSEGQSDNDVDSYTSRSERRDIYSHLDYLEDGRAYQGNESVSSSGSDTDSSGFEDTLDDAKDPQDRGAQEENAKMLAFIQANVDEWTSSNAVQSSQHPLESREKDLERPQSSSESATSFQSIYTCLPNADSIRLLRLHGSAIESDPVHCTLLVHGLRDPSRPTFEALSYTWADLEGDSSLCEAIFVGSQYDVLPVTKNCLAALKCFRTGMDRFVWVDAICINQFDLKERGHQVSLMRDIYTSAARVLTYLGNSDETLGVFTGLPHYNDERFGNGYKIPVDEMAAILYLPYFSRIWVIQEVLLNKAATLTVGEHTLHWQDFQDLVRRFSPNRDRIPALVRDKPSHNETGYSRLLSWLEATKDCRCGDPRDRIYGLMGLSSRIDQSCLPVDYSISKQQLYVGLAMYWLAREDRRGKLISAVLDQALLPKTTPFLPSWTPDWTPQPHTGMDREGSILTPLILQFDTTIIERPSSGLNWFHDNKVRWTLDDVFQGHRGLFTNFPHWYRLAVDSGRGPLASVKPLPLSGTLALEAVHILSISTGRLELTDHNGRLLHGLQLARSKESQFRRPDSPHGEIHLYMFMNWQEALALRKHANAVYSLHDRFRIVSAPLGADVPSNFGDVSAIEKRLEHVEAVISMHWLMDLFFYGIRAGSAYADLLKGSKMNERWSKCLPRASAACEVLNLPFKIHTGEDYRYPTIAEMIEISEDARDFVDKDEGPWESGSSSESLESNSDPRDYPDSSQWPYYVSEVYDEMLTRQIQKAHAARLETASSPGERWTHLRSVVGECRDLCTDYAPLQQAMSDLGFRVNERLSERHYGPIGIEFLHLLAPDSVRTGAKKMGPHLKVDWTITNIMSTAWALSQELKIDPKFTLEQNCSIVWIHVLTMEMVARLRGCLQQRLILNAIRDKMRHSRKIYLI